MCFCFTHVFFCFFFAKGIRILLRNMLHFFIFVVNVLYDIFITFFIILSISCALYLDVFLKFY